MASTLARLREMEDVLLMTGPRFEDERGDVQELFRLGELEEEVGRKLQFLQMNHARSWQGVLRGLHVAAYDKLLYVLEGNAELVFVDLRPESRAFGTHVKLRVNDDNRPVVFLPAGFGNAYLVESELVYYLYWVTAYYDPRLEKTIRWDDPDLAIPWRTIHPVLSERDRTAAALRKVFPGLPAQGRNVPTA